MPSVCAPSTPTTPSSSTCAAKFTTDLPRIAVHGATSHCGPSTDGRVFARSVEADDVAVATGMWQTDRSIGLMVLRRQPDGSWRVLIDLLGEVS
jgi:hypothetical protein